MSEEDPDIFTLDGGVLEGGGQVVRLAIALSVLLSKPISIVNIRQKRADPGLKAQHAAGLKLAADICSGALTGCKVKSTSITLQPGTVKPFGRYLADPRTAGSTTLLLQIALPCLIFASQDATPQDPVDLTLRGGTNATQAPQIDWTEQILLPFLRQHYGLDPRVTIRKRGYFPKGGGEIHFTIPTIPGPLPPITLTNRGNIISVKGKAWVAGLPRSLALEMRKAARRALIASALGITEDIIEIEAIREEPRDAVGSGSGIVLWAETDEGCRIGGSCIGLKGKDTMDVGEEAAQELIRNLAHGACVDEYLQDQIIVFMALASGESTVRTGPLTLHTQTAIHVAEQLTDARFTIVEDIPGEAVTITCQGIAFTAKNHAR
ncbi:RNA 3'-terminal phosphate cyclase [Cristinia sonorae]|uniref:RNA 3'-terminal phosphate cyclase n=1 Tax=Cristinia sonorae TaxID=1940300 RepID=A0A8K0UUF1_9AGAR|nr:RNA 3'-terminal phosphate cyclase [Cristinia sonorae]